MQQVRIAVTATIEELLKRYRDKYPTLNDTEILKMLVSKGDYMEKQAEKVFSTNEASSKQERIRYLVNKLSKKAIPVFENYVKEKRMDYGDLTEEEVYDLISKI